MLRKNIVEAARLQARYDELRRQLDVITSRTVTTVVFGTYGISDLSETSLAYVKESVVLSLAAMMLDLDTQIENLLVEHSDAD